jgi:COP9 signalosome complex subunit 2
MSICMSTFTSAGFFVVGLESTPSHFTVLLSGVAGVAAVTSLYFFQHTSLSAASATETFQRDHSIMSDEEYEYEYDDDEDVMEEEDNGFEYTDEEDAADDGEVAPENAYYNAKGLRETNLDDAAEAFEKVIVQEQSELKKKDSTNKYGTWSYKAMKQLVKLHLRSGNASEMMRHYNRLLDCIADGDVNPNAVEKGIHGMLERLSSMYQGGGSGGGGPSSASSRLKANTTATDGTDSVLEDPQQMALAVYDATLKVFHPSSGACPNERLWFKTNLKYGQLLYEMNETAKLQQVLRDLKATTGSGSGSSEGGEGGGGSSSGSSTQSMEIYALQIQLYSRQKDNKKLREVFNKAMSVLGGIPHPRTLALIQELGGKMHMAAREYESAGKTFFQAFKSYDEAGDPSRLRCLKYLVLASMLSTSSINPFDSQEARPYRDDPEITAMTNLVQAFHNNEIQKFERILRQNNGRVMEDEFVREHVEDLLRTIRTQVLRRVIRPYTRITLTAIARELNDIPVEDVESLLVSLILNGTLDGRIDQVAGVLLKQAERGGGTTSNATTNSGDAGGGGGGVSGMSALGSNSSSAVNGEPPRIMDATTNLLVQKYNAMDQLAQVLEDISVSITNARMKESPHHHGGGGGGVAGGPQGGMMRAGGMVH